jgi:hypothetical protein
MMKLEDALNRTLLLMRTDLVEDVTDDQLLEALTGTRVVISAGIDVLCTHSGQSAIITAATLMARSGHEVWIDAEEAALVGPQPPLPAGDLIAGLLAVGADLLPGRLIQAGIPTQRADVAVGFGSAAPRDAELKIALAADDWAAWTESDSEPWKGGAWPIGGMAAGALAAGEAFKSAMRRLAGRARDGGYFSALQEPIGRCTIRLAANGTGRVTVLPDFDIVSGGAIANAALFCLHRLPHVRGYGRVLDDDASALSNLNRNALLVRSAIGELKVRDLARFKTGITIEPVPARYREGMGLAEMVLVGVDDIPSRWAAQRQVPAWLGVGATEGFAVNVSEHRPGEACAGCLHSVHVPTDGPIPTAAFVSFWSGLQLVARWLRTLAGASTSATSQQLYGNALRPDNWSFGSMPVAPHAGCPVGCTASKATRASAA